MEELFHPLMCSEAAAWMRSQESAFFFTFFVHHVPMELTGTVQSESQKYKLVQKLPESIQRQVTKF